MPLISRHSRPSPYVFGLTNPQGVPAYLLWPVRIERGAQVPMQINRRDVPTRNRFAPMCGLVNMTFPRKIAG